MKRLAVLLATLLLLWGQPCLAAIAIIAGAGTGGAWGSTSAASGATTMVIVGTGTNDVPAGSLTVVGTAWRSGSGGAASCTDSASTANTYVFDKAQTANSSVTAGVCRSYTGFDLPAPCTVTATETSTTLAVTAAVSCSGTDVLTVGQNISGGSFTGQISAPCTLVAGAASCTITGGATVGTPGTATISSTITVTFNTTSNNRGGIAAAFSGAASSPYDTASTTATGSSTGAISVGPTGTLATSSEVLFGNVNFLNTGAVTEDAAFTSLGTITTNAFLHVGFRVVASNAAITWGPSLGGSSGVWAAQLIAFKASGGAAISHFLSSTGAGQ